MAIRTTNQGKDFELAPPGVHVARCCKVIDCGTQVNETFKKRQRKAWLFWELPNTQRQAPSAGGDPFIVGKQYTLSHNEKSNLRGDLESWYGRRFSDEDLEKAGGFDLERLIDRPALLNIVHSTDGKYANVMAVMPLPNGTICPPMQTTPVVFGFDPYSQQIFESLSQGMQEYIKGSEEWQLEVNGHQPAHAMAAAPAAPSGDVPFGPTPARSPAPARAPAPGQAKAPAGKFDDMEDDIPF